MKLVTDDGTEIALERIRVLNVEPGDVVVLRCPDGHPEEAYRRLVEQAQALFGNGTRVVALEGIDISVVREGA